MLSSPMQVEDIVYFIDGPTDQSAGIGILLKDWTLHRCGVLHICAVPVHWGNPHLRQNSKTFISTALVITIFFGGSFSELGWIIKQLLWKASCCQCSSNELDKEANTVLLCLQFHVCKTSLKLQWKGKGRCLEPCASYQKILYRLSFKN